MKLVISDALLSLLIGIFLNRRANGAPIAGDVGFGEEVTLLAKDSILKQGSKIAFNNKGYTGNGFIDFGGVGSSASWTMDIPVAGFYDVTIRYASKSNRGPIHLLIDDVKAGAFDAEKVANNWNTWKDETINVRIDGGSNRNIKIFASIKQGPNIDKMTVKLLRPISPEPVEDLDYKVILNENECLERGVFQDNESGMFEVGFDDGDFLVLRKKDTSQVLWSLKGSGENLSSKICLKNDGSLVAEPIIDNEEICDKRPSGLYERNFSFRFGINNSGGIAIFLDSKRPLWTGGVGSGDSTPPTQVPIPVPTWVPTFAPTNVSTLGPTSKQGTQAPAPSRMPNNNDAQYKIVLSQHNYFGKDKNNFGRSDSGEFEVGMNQNGNLVVRRTGSNSGVVWTLKDSKSNDIVGERLYMQQDGNLVMRTENRKAVWTSGTADRNGRTGYSLGINNCGGIAVYRTPNPMGLVWIGGIQDTCGALAPQESPTPLPVLPSPVAVPSPSSDINRPTSRPYSIVLASNDRMLERDRFISSPNGQYNVGLDKQNGELIIRRGTNNDKVWTLMDKNGEKVSNISRMYMQSDGNLVLKTSSNKSLWNSETSKNAGAEFRIDNGGQLSINFQGAALWIDGLPRNIYSGPSSSDLNFPLRGFFYYAVSSIITDCGTILHIRDIHSLLRCN